MSGPAARPPRLDRRAALALAGAALPAAALARRARAEEPPAARPAAPAPASPVVPPFSRPPAGGIDRTKAYYVFFDQPIDIASMRSLRQELANLTDAGVASITLVLDLPGGMLEPTLVTYGFIRALPARISTHAQGFVQSAATVLFLAGEQRSADRTARFVFHPVQSSFAGMAGEAQMRERLTAFNSVTEVVAEIYRDRTGLPPQEIERFGRETVIYTPDQARTAGVVQAVQDLRIPGDGQAKIVLLG